MDKKKRQYIFNKFGGRCAYCGEQLPLKGWHVDELLPVKRIYEMVRDQAKGKWVRKMKGLYHPERFHVDNQMPACPSCNINKHSMSLEEFRDLITNFTAGLNKVNTQYKIAKRYGLIQETGKEVKFYFETFNAN